MSRSRSYLLRLAVPLAGLLASLSLGSPTFAATTADAWSPRLSYVLTTGETRAALTAALHLTKVQDAKLRGIGRDLERAQAEIQRRSDLVVMDDGLTLEQKREAIARLGYNYSLESAEESASSRAAAVAGMSTVRLGDAVGRVWDTDAATHRLDTALTEMGLTPQSVVGSFRVYATRFYDEYGGTFGVAVPDKFVKFASNGYPDSGNTARPAGYPDGSYAVGLYWDGVHRGRDNDQNVTVTSPHSVAAAKVVDVGPWNQDDNWWDSYSDPQRPRRINNAGISGNDGLVGRAHVAFGLPESQAAYFDYYGRPAKIPAHTTSPENYWDKQRGYGGQWSGADQFGRQVTQPAAIDLTPPCYAAMGMTDNEWIDVVPLWEARLDVVGGVKMTAGPYLTGQRVTCTFTVKNLGSLPGTWDALTYTFKTSDGAFKNPPYQAAFTLPPGGTKTVSFTQTLDTADTLTGFPQAQRAGSWSHVGTDTATLSVAPRLVDRASGPTRYDTAVAVSRAGYPGTASAVVVATGKTFPDALAGAALAHAEGGPLLLVGDTVPASVDAEIARLKPARIFVLGSEKALSEAVAEQLAADAPAATLTRLGGTTRYGTARAIAAQVATHSGGKAAGGTAIVAIGRDFPDALSASVLSADKGWPILLTEPTKVPADTSAAVKDLGVTSTLVIGSDRVIAPSVVSALHGTRLSGPTRYDTAAAVADYAETHGLTYNYVGLAVGTSFPDALSGGVLAARAWGTLLLTSPSGLPSATRYRLQRHRTTTTHLQAFGSERALSDDVFEQAIDALR